MTIVEATQTKQPTRHGRKERVRASRGLWLTGPLTALLLFLIVVPVGVLFYAAFSKSSPSDLQFSLGNLTLDNVRRIVTSRALMDSALLTLEVVAIGAAMALFVASILAWLVARTDIPFRRVIAGGVMAPLFLSPLVSAIAWSALGLPRSGFINLALQDLGIPITVDIGTRFGLAFVMATTYIPYAYILIVNALQGLDATVEEAAAICGADVRQTLRRVTMPLVAPATYSAGLLVAVTLLGLYAIPFMIGEPAGKVLLTSYIGRMVLTSPPDYQGAAVIGLVVTILTVMAAVLQTRLLGRRAYTTMTGKANRHKRVALKRWRPVLAGISLFYVLVCVVLPILALMQMTFQKSPFYSSVKDLFNLGNLSLDNFQVLFANPSLSRSIPNSLFVGFLAALFGTVIAFTISYLKNRTRILGGHLLDSIAIIPVAVPGLIIGLGFLWGWIRLPIYGTLWALVAAFVAHQMPVGVRSIDSTLVQVHMELEEAASVSGAGRLRTIRSIVLPLARSGILGAATLIFVVSVREVGTILFLYNSSTTVMSVEILNSWTQGSAGAAAALALIQACIIAVFVGISRTLTSERSK